MDFLLPCSALAPHVSGFEASEPRRLQPLGFTCTSSLLTRSCFPFHKPLSTSESALPADTSLSLLRLLSSRRCQRELKSRGGELDTARRPTWHAVEMNDGTPSRRTRRQLAAYVWLPSLCTGPARATSSFGWQADWQMARRPCLDCILRYGSASLLDADGPFALARAVRLHTSASTSILALPRHVYL